MEEVFCSDLFSESQLLGLDLAIEIRAIVLRVSACVMLGDDAKLAAAWRQSTIRTASLPLPDI